MTIDLSDASWIPFSIDPDHAHINFVKTSRAQLAAAPFLDQRFLTPENEIKKLPVSEVLKSEIPQAAKPGFIFHSAFCCSTLMAGALDIPGKILALKEPEIIMSLANAKRMTARNNAPKELYQSLFKVIMALLSRRFSPDERLVIKATNSANNLVEDISAIDAPFFMMQSTLKDFLISVLKKGESCKSFIRTQYNIFTLDPGPLSQINPRQAMTLTDLQVAALVWRHQMRVFAQHGRGRPVINDQEFLGDKAATLRLAADALDVDMTTADIEAVLASGYFSKNVKSKDEAL